MLIGNLFVFISTLDEKRYHDFLRKKSTDNNPKIQYYYQYSASRAL